MTLQLREKPKFSQPPLPLKERHEEQKLWLDGISWERFKNLDASFEGIPSIRLSYATGVLEIMTISPKHEYLKSTLSVLLEAYMREKDIRHYIRGGFTLMKEGETSGEPDESYCIGEDKELPDLIIEVIITSGSINKLDIYKPKGVPEVWFWKSNKLRVFHLKGEDYQEVIRSEFLPELDLDTLLHYTQYQDQYDAVQAFVKNIRE
ncbi:Uma2 family endonuclease [Candidatus Parabeggiatoa sp. HSG14]|uniref:Uma2 family endonuclease n=1 Tax=Candidatus Parabeggiatoa sp. HSG14 TaxID=3055593 RepID=UPI0025A88F78|nr:Uma2 family endonuclease [Thiotrichales bacterium HSG14]